MSTHRQTDIATSTHTETKPNALPCIHIGLPKTATTTLQQYLFPRHPGLSYLGKYNRQGLFGDYPFAAAKKLNQHLLNLRKTFGVRNAVGMKSWLTTNEIDELQRQFELANHAGKITIYSQEAICGLSEESTDKFAELLVTIFGKCRILVTIREPLSFTKSQYFQMLKSHNVASGRELKKHVGSAPRYFDINEWALLGLDHQAHSLKRMLEIGKVAKLYAKYFGTEQIKFIIFEQLKSDASVFFNELSVFLGIDPTQTLQLSENR